MVVVWLVAIAAGPIGAAIAAPPSVTIESPPNGSVRENQTPSFSGHAEAPGGEVTLRIYNGPTATGTVIQELDTRLLSSNGMWSLGPTEPLPVGTYTAQATQTNLALETGKSSPVTFTLHKALSVAPTVTLDSPTSPSSNTMPSFTGSASDITPVTVQIHAGATARGTVVSTATATGTGAGWMSGSASPALPSGQYTAVAIQAGSLSGNPAARSKPVTFTVTPPTPGEAASIGPPVASFTWFPSVPTTGAPVSLVSTSTDVTSPIVGIAWALTSSGPFQGGGTVLTTSFSTSGAHVVRLRVIDAYGLSNVAAAMINVVGPTVSLMQPFPVVRIAGNETASGVRLRLLTVQQVPAGARITVRCKGRGCPIRSERRVAASSKQGAAAVKFRRFERSLRFGITLEILVSKPGKIGKYTRFAIRRGKLPARVDMCLDPAGLKPLVCPSS